jgi:fatty-acyl-CoA synthase
VIFPSFVPAQTLAAMARERATVQFLVPAMWAALMAVPDFDDYDLSALELAVSGGAPCPLPVIDYFQGRGLPFQEGFGMTETAPAVSILDAGHVKEKAGSIGRALMHVQARIVDEDDRDVRSDEVGRTCPPATGGCPGRRRRRSAAAGSTLATWAGWTPKDSSPWWTARRT